MYLKQWNRKIDKANNYGWIVHFGCDHSLCCKQMTAVEQTGHLDLRHPPPPTPASLRPRQTRDPKGDACMSVSYIWRMNITFMHHTRAIWPRILHCLFEEEKKERKQQSHRNIMDVKGEGKETVVAYLRVILFDEKEQPHVVDVLCQHVVGLGQTQLGRRARVHRPCRPNKTVHQQWWVISTKRILAVVSNTHTAHPSGGE